MSNQLLKDSTALRMFFTEPVYITADPAAIPAIDTGVAEEKTAAQENPVTSHPVTETFRFIGKNKRNILILVNDATNDISNPDGTALLRNIVKHLNFDKDDFALLNFAKYTDASFTSLKSFFNCKTLFAFGVTAQQLNLPENAGSGGLKENTRIVLATNLEEMAENIAAKKAFWNILKTIDTW